MSEVQKTNAEMAEEAFNHAISTVRQVRGKENRSADLMEARLLGKNILREELGAFSETHRGMQPYDLDVAVRDTLIAHTREDIAVVFALQDRANKQLYELKELQSTIKYLLILLSVLVIFFGVWNI